MCCFLTALPDDQNLTLKLTRKLALKFFKSGNFMHAAEKSVYFFFYFGVKSHKLTRIIVSMMVSWTDDTFFLFFFLSQ